MMKPVLMHFGSAIVALGLAYAVNQLPNIPENLKPWVPFGMVPLVVLTVWFLVEQSSGTRRSRTKFKRNTLQGDRSKIRAVDADVTGK